MKNKIQQAPMRSVAVWALLIGATALSVGFASPPSKVQAQNKELVQKSFEAWKRGTGSPFDLLADNASWTITGNSVMSKIYPSKAAFINEVIQPFNARMSSRLIPTVHRIYADGNSVVIYFDADGTARDGKPYHNSYAWFFDFKSGKIVNAVAFFDSVEFNDFWKRVSPAL